jgi:site-specific DNA-adenine methylase
MDMYAGAPNWRSKKKACDYLISESELDDDLVYAFLVNNSFYGMYRFPKAEKFKRDFILVKWLKHPSDYGTNKMREDISWLPTDWFKKLS